MSNLGTNVEKFLKDYANYINGKNYSHFILYFRDNSPSYPINYAMIIELLNEADVYPFNLLKAEEIYYPEIATVINNSQHYKDMQGGFVRNLNNGAIDFYKAIGCKIYKLNPEIQSFARFIIMLENFGGSRYVSLDKFLEDHKNALMVGSSDPNDWEEI